ncbi:MAG: acylphosphatase [Anaerolineales bacterium]|nr:acylphosphatase [Anaerolineales bacterium]
METGKTIPDENNTRLHAVVSGRVQGVSFRYFVSEQAQRIGVKGWVRNRWQGTVEVMAEGTEYELKILLDALRQGPPAARVDDVDYEWLPGTGEFSSFWVRSTG